MPSNGKRRLRSQLWFDNPDNPGMTALYLERYLNYGLTKQELTSGKPIVGIAQSGSDLSPCNRHHRELAERVREGIHDAGGIAFEFPMHPIQETGKRPTAALDRNLAYLSLVEVLFGYPLDGVVLTTGCDKTTPAAIMAAATVNTPAIVLSGGPMLNGWWKGERAGSGTVVWWARQEHAAGRMNYRQFLDLVASSAPSIGHCNTMGTASTMNALAEALGMSLPGCAAIPAPYRERAQMAYQTGLRAVAIVHEDLKPSDILTRKAFENAIMACAAIAGSTNAPIHINAIARHAGVKLGIADWEKIGLDIPLLVDMQPAGKYLGEEYFRPGEVAGCRRDPPLRKADEGGRGLQGAERQPVRLRHHEAVRHFRRIPPTLSRKRCGPQRLRRALRGVRGPGGLPPPHRGSGAGHRRKHPPGDPRRRPDRLSGFRRGGQHAAAGGADQTWDHVAALHRRRPPIRHLGLALDPQRIAGSGGERRPCAVAHWRPYPYRP